MSAPNGNFIGSCSKRAFAKNCHEDKCLHPYDAKYGEVEIGDREKKISFPTSAGIAPSEGQANPIEASSVSNSPLSHLLERNRAWAARITAQDPTFFSALSHQQRPELLWIGCSDSRVPANEIVDLLPGQVFVHRNIANVVPHTDINVLSVLQFAVDVLQVKHVIVCGHYGCGGIRAAMDNKQLGLIDNWLRHIKDVYVKNEAKLEALEDDQARWDLLTEYNVCASVEAVCQTTIVQNAWARGQELSVHGWCYRLTDGCIRDLEVVIRGPSEIGHIYRVVSGKKSASK